MGRQHLQGPRAARGQRGGPHRRPGRGTCLISQATTAPQGAPPPRQPTKRPRPPPRPRLDSSVLPASSYLLRCLWAQARSLQALERPGKLLLLGATNLIGKGGKWHICSEGQQWGLKDSVHRGPAWCLRVARLPAFLSQEMSPERSEIIASARLSLPATHTQEHACTHTHPCTHMYTCTRQCMAHTCGCTHVCTHTRATSPADSGHPQSHVRLFTATFPVAQALPPPPPPPVT